MQNKRVSDVAKVTAMKAKLPKTNTVSTNRNKVTQFISSLKNRQKEVPLAGNFIDCAKCEPLHLKNSCLKEMFMKLFKICASKTDFSMIIACARKNLCCPLA